MLVARIRSSNPSNFTGDLDISVVNSNNAMQGPIFNDRALALTSGLSFGLMSSVIEYVYIFYNTVGPGTHFNRTNPGYFFINAGELVFICLVLTLHN